MLWPLLAPLSEQERAALLAASRRRTFAKGEVVFHEGDPADSLHLVASGHLAVRVSTPDGSTATLNILSPGDSVGELALVGREGAHRRSATVRALDAAETRVISSVEFHGVCARHPAVKDLLVDLLADRVRQLSERLLDSLYVGLDRRLYRCLVDLTAVYGEGATSDVEVPLTQDHLADLVGGTRPSVNQVLQRLAGQRVIELGRGRLIVRDLEALRRKAGR